LSVTKGAMNSNDKSRLLQLFFNESDELYSIFDGDMRYVEVNDAFLRTFRLQREDVIGKHITEVSPDVKKSGRLAIYEEVWRTGEMKVVDATLHPSLGKIRARIKVFKLDDGIGAVMQNITDLHNAIEELDTISYRSSHDLSSPIASILGLVNLAKKDATDLVVAKDYFRMIGERARDMDKLLRQIRATMSIRHGEHIANPIDFTELCDKVLQSVKQEHADVIHNISVRIETSNRFYGDRYLLGVVMENVIDNAFKYGLDGEGVLTLTVSVCDKEDGVAITITDKGMGIAEEYREDVFKMFVRASQLSRGAGLGLYTVKNVVTRLGGHVAIESKPGIGTTVSIEVPGTFGKGRR